MRKAVQRLCNLTQWAREVLALAYVGMPMVVTSRGVKAATRSMQSRWPSVVRKGAR